MFSDLGQKWKKSKANVFAGTFSWLDRSSRVRSMNNTTATLFFSFSPPSSNRRSMAKAQFLFLVWPTFSISIFHWRRRISGGIFATFDIGTRSRGASNEITSGFLECHSGNRIERPWKRSRTGFDFRWASLHHSAEALGPRIFVSARSRRETSMSFDLFIQTRKKNKNEEEKIFRRRTKRKRKVNLFWTTVRRPVYV